MQQERKKGCLLLFTYGDHMCVWAEPSFLEPFEGTEAQLQSEGVGRLHKLAIREAIREAELSVSKDTTPAMKKRTCEAVVVTPATANKSRTQRANRIQSPAPASVSPCSRACHETMDIMPYIPDCVVTETLSAYELKRLENMRQNQLVIEKLGVTEATQDLRAVAAPPRYVLDPAIVQERAAQRAQALVEATLNKRASSRLKDIVESGGGRPLRYADEYSALEEAEDSLHAEHARAKRKARSLAARRSGGGRKAAVKELSEEERASLAAAEGWLDEMKVRWGRGRDR